MHAVYNYSETCLIRPPFGPKFVALIECAEIMYRTIENCGLNNGGGLITQVVLKTGFTVLTLHM